MANGNEPEPLEIPGFSFGRMADDQYFFSRAVLESERFYTDITTFLQCFKLEPGVPEQLLRYQRESILTPGAVEKILDFDYDFPSYFEAILDNNPIPLERRAMRLRFTFDDDISTAQKYFHTVIQLGRFSNKVFFGIEYLPATN